MPTNARITNLLDSNDHERLLRELARPDTSLPLSLRLVLDDARWQGPVARAMALARLIEASYRPSGRVLALLGEVTADARRLLDERAEPDQAPGHAVAIAAIAGALGAWEARLDLLGSLDVRLPAPHDEGVAERVAHALCAWTHDHLANEDPLETTPERVGVLWVLGLTASRPIPGITSLVASLASRLEEFGGVHHPQLGDLFRSTQRRQIRRLSCHTGAPLAA